MPVEMEHRLPASWTGIDDYTVVLEAEPARRGRDEVKHLLGLMRSERLNVPQRFDVAFRNDENMHVGFRGDIFEREHAGTASDDGGWNLAGDDLAEDAVSHALGRNDAVVAQRRRLNSLETAKRPFKQPGRVVRPVAATGPVDQDRV